MCYTVSNQKINVQFALSVSKSHYTDRVYPLLYDVAFFFFDNYSLWIHRFLADSGNKNTEQKGGELVREPKSTTSMDSNTRQILVVDDYIIYILNKDCKADYLTYNETLLKILKLDKLKPYRKKNGRLAFKVNCGGKDITFFLSVLAYGCYSNRINAETFIEDIQAFSKYKRGLSLDIDHADDNKANNTIFNLSLIDSTLNKVKGTTISRTKAPNGINAIYYRGKYRVETTAEIKAETMQEILSRYSDNLKFDIGVSSYSSAYFICDTPYEFINCLKYITDAKCEWVEPIKALGKWTKKDGVCWCENINLSLLSQKTLSLMPESRFKPFKSILTATKNTAQGI